MECPYLNYKNGKIETIVDNEKIFCELKNNKLIQPCIHAGDIEDISLCYFENRYENCKHYKANVLKDLAKDFLVHYIKIYNENKFSASTHIDDFEECIESAKYFIEMCNQYNLKHKINSLYDCYRFANSIYIAVNDKVFPDIMGRTCSNFNCNCCPFKSFDWRTNKRSCDIDEKLNVEKDIYITKTHIRISNCPLYKNSQEEKKCQ